MIVFVWFFIRVTMVWRVKVKGDGAPCQLTNHDRVLNCRYQFSESHFLSTTLQSDKRAGGEANRAPLYERIHTQDAKYKCQTSDQLRTISSAGMVLSIAMYTKTIYCSTTIIILHTLVPEWGVVVALKIDAIWYHRNAYMCRIIRQ